MINRIIVFLGSAICILFAGLQAYANRAHIFQNDAVSYLDISDFIIQHRFDAVVNAHWSPLYPLLIAAVRTLCHPFGLYEPSIVKIANFFVYVLLVGAFNYYLISFQKLLRLERDDLCIQLPSFIISATLFIVFGWCSLVLVGVYMDSPDMLAGVIVLFAAALTIELCLKTANKKQACVLGFVLGLGYLAKAATFPIGLSFFAVVLCSTRIRLRRRLNLVGIALIAMLVVSLPWICCISCKSGHLTISDSGYFAYIVYVMRASIGPRPQESYFLHPARIIETSPNTIEFAMRDGGTYPLWTNPIHWNQGVKLKASPVIFKQIAGNVLYYLLLLGVPTLSYCVQYLVAHSRFYAFHGTVRSWGIWLPPLLGLGAYVVAIPMILIGESRYVACYVLLIMSAILASVRIRKSGQGYVAIALTLFLMCVIPVADTAKELVTDIKLASCTPSYRDQLIAQGLQNLGIGPASRIALLGTEEEQGTYRFVLMGPPFSKVQQSYYYFARLAHVQIVSQICVSGSSKYFASRKRDAGPMNGASEFLESSDEAKLRVYNKLRNLGITAIVYNPANEFDRIESGLRSEPEDFAENFDEKKMPPGWLEIDHLNSFVYLLRK